MNNKENISSDNEIEIYYRYCDIDKEHEYSVVCKERGTTSYNYSGNGWIFWIWYKMGIAFGKVDKMKFRLLPFKNTWDEKCKLIKKYKSCNSGTDRVVPAILSHFKKVSNGKQ